MCVCVCMCGSASSGPYASVAAEQTLCLLRKTLEGVEYIHSKGIMHRDLKVILCLEKTPPPLLKRLQVKVFLWDEVECQTCAFIHVHSGGVSVGNGFDSSYLVVRLEERSGPLPQAIPVFLHTE